MRSVASAVSLVLLLVCAALAAAPARAGSWLVDQQRYSLGSHGGLACRDCHQDLGGPHPDKARIDGSFTPASADAMCLNCHYISGELATRGRHASTADLSTCTACHQAHYPDQHPGDKAESLDGDSAGCMVCHAAPSGGAADSARLQAMCMTCHQAPQTSGGVAAFDLAAFRASPHGALDCAACHVGAAASPHQGGSRAACTACHAPHGEKTLHDAHSRVDCAACHLDQARPLLDAASGRVAARIAGASQPHAMSPLATPASCARCHIRGNTVGAADMVLPPKGLLCLPCHTATFSAGDPLTIIGLALLALGLVLVGGAWLGGSPAPAPAHGRPKGRARAVCAALLLDGLLQRRLWHASRPRWAIHALIFLPFVARGLYGLAGLLLSLLAPGLEITAVMLDKNSAVTGLWFDLTGCLVILGVALAIVRRRAASATQPAGMPGPDWAAAALLAAMIISGFVLEAARIAMSGMPPGSAWSFAGYALAAWVTPGPALQTAYGYIWYAHAVVVAGLAAYLPWSRMLHMITAPVALALRAARGGR